MISKITHYAGCVLANIRLHQLPWGDWEMRTTISCTKCCQAAGLTECVHVVTVCALCELWCVQRVTWPRWS